MDDTSKAGKKRTVLIIEDEPGIVDTLTYALGTEGFDALSGGDRTRWPRPAPGAQPSTWWCSTSAFPT